MSLIAIIPARSGSKGIPGKNISLLGGIPLFAYSILAAKMVQDVDRIIVSTDSQEYAKIANTLGAETPFLRPNEISGDKATDFELFKHALEWFRDNESYHPDYMLHLRPTTPLRDPTVLDTAVELFMRKKNVATSLRSGHVASESPYKWFLKDADDYFKGLRDDLTPEKVNLPRQSFPDVYIPDGYVDILKSSVVESSYTLHGDKMLVFESPHCVEVDTIDDFKYLEYQIAKDGSPILDYYKLQKS